MFNFDELKNFCNTTEYIDALVGKLHDVGIPPQFGIFVTTSDYSEGAREQAKKVGIRLLIIKDVLHDIGPAIQQAIQTTIFLLPVINGLRVENFAPGLMNVAEAMVLFNKQDEAVSTVPDQIWLAWNTGEISGRIGESEIEVEFSDALYQRVGGKLTPVTKIVVKVSILGLVQQVTGSASFHRLQNGITNIIEREQLKARFDLLQIYPYIGSSAASMMREKTLPPHLEDETSQTKIRA